MSSLDRWNYYIHYFVHKHIKNAKLNNSATNQINFFPVEKFTQALFQERTKDK